MDEKLYMWSNFILNLLFSQDCLCCHYHKSTNTGLCQGCFRDLAHIRYGCRQCGLPVGADHLCACKDEDWPFSHCLSACAYSFPVDALIAQLKIRKRLSVCASLAELIVQQVQQQRLPLPELLLPAPSHAHKLRQRGFNPAAELATVVGKRLHLPVDKRALSCNTALASQKTLSRKQRSLNVDGGFSLQHSLSVQRVALIDDVLTTGATTRALAYLLREHGVHDIQVWTVARTLPAGFFC
jgi:ComF family protein